VKVVDKNELTAELALQKSGRKQALEKEFEALRPGLRSMLVRGLGTVAAMLFIVWYFPEILQQPVSYLLLILIFGVSAEIYRESKQVHKRMDVLYKLLKDDI
jgi:hypothetical protein